MDDFEKAIRVVFSQDPSISPAIREQANGLCEAVKQRPDCWQFCWEQFLRRDCLEVKFWCLQLLPCAVRNLPPQTRAELRGQVLVWLRDVLPTKGEEPVIRNKVALVYVALLRLDYPAHWPSAWRDLVGLLEKGRSLVDMYLRILATFDQEVVSDEVPRSAEDRQFSQSIKHAMREGDVLHLAESWFMILGNFRQSDPQLVVECLKAVSLYIVWVEILTVANDKFLGVICSIVSEGGAPAAEACQCLSAVISKKMPAGKKVQMLEQLQILRRLEGCIHRNSTDLSLLEREAELFNGVGEVALEAYVDLRVQTDEESKRAAQAAWEFLKALMPLVFWFFSHQECRIAGSVEPFLTQFFVKVKAFVAGGDTDAMPDQPGPNHMVSLEQVRPILTQTLQLIIQRIAYPDWFQHDNDFEDDERHVAFVEFRRSLTKIYRRIFLVDEPLGFQFVQASMAQLTQMFASVRPMEVEAVLYLYKEASEVVKDLGQHLQAAGPLAGCFIQLCDCEALIRSDHWAVQLGLIELYVRYGKIFALHAELFARYGQRVLEAFLGRQGIRSGDQRVVTRACFMLLRFLKVAKKQVAPFTVQIYEAVKDLMVVQYLPSSLVPVQADGSLPKVVVKGTLKADDQACLYEALASLVTALPAEQMRPSLQMLLKVPADILTEILAAPPARIAADVQGYASWAARGVEAIANVSKAFTVQHAGMAADWEAALAVVARILERFAGSVTLQAGLWRSALFLCRRMVEVLGEQVLTPLDTLLPLLCNSSSHAELTEISIFAHQVVCQHHQKALPLVQKWLRALFLRPYEVWRGMPDQSEQLKREKLELGCALLQLLKEAAQRCPAALLEPILVRDDRLGVDLTAFLVHGLTDPGELKALFLSVSAWSGLLELAATSQEAMATLPLQQLLQQLLWSVARMDFGDAQAQKILNEAASILRSLVGARSASRQQAMEGLQQALVAALPGLRNEVMGPRRLCEALSQDTPIKDVRIALQQCVTDWRWSCAG